MIWLVACGPSLQDPGVREPVAVEARVERAKVGSGEPIVYSIETRARDGWSLEPVEVPLPEALQGEQRQDGDTLVITLTGPDGSYELEALQVVATGPEGQTLDLGTTPIFVDIGVEGPSASLADPASAPRPEPPLWPWVVGAALGAGVVAGGAYAAWQRFKPVPPPPPPTPPHLVALRAWTEAKARHRGDDHALALALSDIFRRYTADATPVRNATALTSAELLDQLPQDWDRARCKRLLTATDLIKFAGGEGGRALFQELDADLKAVIGA